MSLFLPPTVFNPWLVILGGTRDCSNAVSLRETFFSGEQHKEHPLGLLDTVNRSICRASRLSTEKGLSLPLSSFSLSLGRSKHPIGDSYCSVIGLPASISSSRLRQLQMTRRNCSFVIFTAAFPSCEGGFVDWVAIGIFERTCKWRDANDGAILPFIFAPLEKWKFPKMMSGSLCGSI